MWVKAMRMLEERVREGRFADIGKARQRKSEPVVFYQMHPLVEWMDSLDAEFAQETYGCTLLAHVTP